MFSFLSGSIIMTVCGIAPFSVTEESEVVTYLSHGGRVLFYGEV
jgi:hypothetical protein